MSAISNNEQKVNAPNHFFCCFFFSSLLFKLFVSTNDPIWVMSIRSSNLIRNVAKFIIPSMNETFSFCLPNVYCHWRLFMRSFSPFQSHFIAINNANTTLSHIAYIFNMKNRLKKRCLNDFKHKFESYFLCCRSVVWLWAVSCFDEWMKWTHENTFNNVTERNRWFLLNVYLNAFFHSHSVELYTLQSIWCRSSRIQLFPSFI